MGKRLVVLVLVLASIALAAGAVYWPTPRRKALARIEALDGTYSAQIDDDGGPHQVNCVIIAARPVTEADLASLRDLRPIHRLMLDGCQIEDDWLVHISELKELELLTLTGCPVTDGGLVHLKPLSNLKVLSLRRTKVTDAGLPHLDALGDLSVISVAYSQVTETGVDALHKAHPKLAGVAFRDAPGD